MKSKNYRRTIVWRRFPAGFNDAAEDPLGGNAHTILSSADADSGLHQRVDPLGQPQQRGAARPVQRELMASVKHGVAQLREPALDEAAFEDPERPNLPNAL